jgi:hypothetical protein
MGRWPSARFDSDTTRNDFSNTFHSLIVLSRKVIQKKYEPRVCSAHTVGGQKEMSGILSFAPLDLVDLLLDLKRLEIVELRFMRLKFRVKLVLAALFL